MHVIQTAKNSCRNLWKLFGKNSSAFLTQHNGNPSDAALAQGSYIATVRNVSFDMHDGEILVVMGLSHRTVIDDVAFPLEVRGSSRAERDGRTRDMLKLVGLEGRENYFPRELSGGQQQRVGIARSLAVGPDVWFLDEPFSALDPLIRREMQDGFLRLHSRLMGGWAAKRKRQLGMPA